MARRPISTRSRRQIGNRGGRVCAVSGNIGDKAAVAKMKQAIDEKLGPVHILVNCAGGDIGAAGGKPNPNNALDISYEDIKVLTENNLIGTMLVCQAFVPPMKAAGSGVGGQYRLGRGAFRRVRRKSSIRRSRRASSTIPVASRRSF